MSAYADDFAALFHLDPMETTTITRSALRLADGREPGDVIRTVTEYRGGDRSIHVRVELHKDRLTRIFPPHVCTDACQSCAWCETFRPERESHCEKQCPSLATPCGNVDLDSWIEDYVLQPETEPSEYDCTGRMCWRAPSYWREETTEDGQILLVCEQHAVLDI